LKQRQAAASLPAHQPACKGAYEKGVVFLRFLSKYPSSPNKTKKKGNNHATASQVKAI
jgi:hypothetical protein